MNEIILSSGLGDTGIANGQYIITDTDGSRIVGTYPVKPPPDLYSDKAKPHVLYLYADREDGLWDDSQWFSSNLPKLQESKVGVVCLFSGYYRSGHRPVAADNLGRLFYEPKYSDEISSTTFLIEDIHAAEMKVVAYLYEPSTWEQDYRTTLLLMDEFAKDFNLDGWYVDGGKFGTQVQTLEAFKHMAKMYSTIVLHDSQSVVDGRWIEAKEAHYPYGIIPSVHVRQYCTHTLTNEALPEFQPKNAGDPLWDTYISDKGIGNTIRSIKYAGRSPMSEEDMYVTAAKRGITIQFKRSNIDNPAWLAYIEEYTKQRATWKERE